MQLTGTFQPQSPQKAEKETKQPNQKKDTTKTN